MRRLWKHPAAVMLSSTMTVLLVAILDYVTGVELRIYPLYFIAIALAAWHARRFEALTTALLCAAAWFISNRLAGRTGDVTILAINTFVQASAFTIVAFLIAELRARVQRESSYARTDPLTGLANTRSFYERAAEELARARRYGLGLTTAYIDLDNFKSVNDERGHGAGDQILAAAAAVMRRTTRVTDVVARIGGDEFVILLPQTNADEAAALMERLRALIEAETRQLGCAATATVGITAFTTPPPTVQELVRQADAAMYVAKQGGKNKVVVRAGSSHVEGVRADDGRRRVAGHAE